MNRLKSFIEWNAFGVCAATVSIFDTSEPRLQSESRGALPLSEPVAGMAADASVHDLAKRAEVPAVTGRDIAAREGLPGDYVEQILLRLRRAGIVTSTRGARRDFWPVTPNCQ